MKKVLKLIAILFLISITIIMFTACGNKSAEEDKQNTDIIKEDEYDEKVIATQTITEENMTMKVTMEFKFKKDKLKALQATYEFENEEDASEFYYDFASGFYPPGTVEQKDKTVIIFLREENFIENDTLSDLFEGRARKEMEEYLIEMGFEIK